MCVHVYTQNPNVVTFEKYGYQIKYDHVILLAHLWNLPNVLKLFGRGLVCHFCSTSNVMLLSLKHKISFKILF